MRPECRPFAQSDAARDLAQSTENVDGLLSRPTDSRAGLFIVAGATFQPRNQSIVLAKPGIGDLTSRSLARRRTRPIRSESNNTAVGLSAIAITMIQDCVVPVGRLSIGTMSPRWRCLPYRPGRTCPTAGTPLRIEPSRFLWTRPAGGRVPISEQRAQFEDESS